MNELGAASTTRDRLLSAAADLFYGHGIAVTGVDAVVARAGLSKPTLYRHFPSKDSLVAGYLAEWDRAQRASLEATLSGQPIGSPDRLLAVFDWLHAWHTDPSFRGCAFVRAAAEIEGADHPAAEIILERKRWLRARLRELAREAGVQGAVQLGDALVLLVEGATTTAFVERDLGAASKARRVARALVTLATTAR